jgi:hypothetical protein
LRESVRHVCAHLRGLERRQPDAKRGSPVGSVAHERRELSVQPRQPDEENRHLPAGPPPGLCKVAENTELDRLQALRLVDGDDRHAVRVDTSLYCREERFSRRGLVEATRSSVDRAEHFVERQDPIAPEHAATRLLQLTRDAAQHRCLPGSWLAGEDEQATVRLRRREELGADGLVDRTSVEDVRIDGISERRLGRMVRNAHP